MLGAILGDIVGSRFEGKTNVPQDFVLMTDDCRFTDDTVHTIAIAKALREHIETGAELKGLAVQYLQEYGRRYLWCGCGDRFYKWLFKTAPKPYESYGNGAAMRVSSCAWFASSLEQALAYAEQVTEITHNHTDAVCGAKAVVQFIWYGRQGVEKQEAYRLLIDSGLYYPQEVAQGKFDVTCKGTVNAAIHAFMNGNSFAEVLRNAVLYGGDTDTTAAVAGSIAEAYYQIPVDIKEQAVAKFDDFLRAAYISAFHLDIL